jgi:melibiose permease/lactose/raffinose/galactose permease
MPDTGPIWTGKFMMVFPLICILIGFLIYRSKYILDEKMYEKIVRELNERK